MQLGAGDAIANLGLQLFLGTPVRTIQAKVARTRTQHEVQLHHTSVHPPYKLTRLLYSRHN